MRTRTNLTRLALLAVASAALAGPLAAPGHAASTGTVTLSNGKITYTAGPGGINSAGLTVFNGEMALFDTEPLVAQGGCRQLTPRAVTCGTTAREFTANLGDMNDAFSVGVTIPGTVDGGAGNDSFLAGTTSASPRSITWSGGAGTDTVSYKGSNAFVLVSLDNEADDGRNIDADNVLGDVEDIVGSTSGGDVLVGDGDANRIDDAGGAGDRLIGQGGDDLLLAKDLAKDTELNCGAGSGDEVVRDKAPLDPTPAGCELDQEF